MRAALAVLLLSFSALAQVPLTDGPGLYENRLDTPPPDHLAAGLAAAARIKPIDGKIVLLSIGMSNTTQEFCARENPAPCTPWSFAGQAAADPEVDRATLVLVNGARGGQTADTWDSPTDENYARIRRQVLPAYGVTEEQVQVAWVKVANAGPTVSLPSPFADAFRLLAQMGNIARALKTRYPNLQIIYFSSRIYAGYASTNLNPEPFAYESGLAVKMLIQSQIDQRRGGGIDPRAGDLSNVPWLAWGPYLWANGATPRNDGLVWLREDFEDDGTHPSASGERKVGALLLHFLKTDPTARPWFLTGPPPRRRAVRK